MLHSHRQWHLRVRLPVGAHLFFVFGVRDLELVSRRHACAQHTDLGTHASGGRELTNYTELRARANAVKTNLPRAQTVSVAAAAINANVAIASAGIDGGAGASESDGPAVVAASASAADHDPFLGLFHHFEAVTPLDAAALDARFAATVAPLALSAAFPEAGAVDAIHRVLRAEFEYLGAVGRRLNNCAEK
jgi:hypothetical protein